MASEVKPWRYEIKYGPEGEDAYSWVYDDHGAMVATMKTHKAKQIVDAMNTRPAPAATDTGLETVGYRYRHVDYVNWTYSESKHPRPDIHNEELVTRSQAEEVLAAERAKVRHWQEQYTEMHSQFIDLAKSAEADNAAKDARIKELEHVVKSSGKIYSAKMRQIEALEAKLETYHEEYENRKEGYEKTIDSLEEKFAAAEKALEPFAKIPVSTVPEGRLGHVPDKHPYMVDLDGNVLFTASDIRKARAVLGGKP